MKTATYQATDIIECPHCGTWQDGVADDFIILSLSNEPRSEECYDCGEFFTVHKEGEDYIVTKVDYESH